MLVNDFLEHSAARTPDKIALVCDGRRLSYAEIDAMANRVAHALIECGVGRGDRVILFLPNSVELVVGIFATLKASGVFVVVNNTTKRDKLIYLVNDCRATALIMRARNSHTAKSVMEDAPSLKVALLTGKDAAEDAWDRDNMVAFYAVQAHYAASCPKRQLIDQDLACLIYTSGSTGEPKGVMAAHSNVVFAASAIVSYLENVHQDVIINVLPLSFDYGLYQLLMTFQIGGTFVLERSFAYPAEILRRMEL